MKTKLFTFILLALTIISYSSCSSDNDDLFEKEQLRETISNTVNLKSYKDEVSGNTIHINSTCSKEGNTVLTAHLEIGMRIYEPNGTIGVMTSSGEITNEGILETSSWRFKYIDENTLEYIQGSMELGRYWTLIE